MLLDLEAHLSKFPTKKLILLPSVRAIKSALATLSPDSKGFLPKITTIDDFFDNLFVFDGVREIDFVTRQILMHQAYIECDRDAKLGFDKEFLRFLSMSEFLDRFFSELRGEMVELSDIDASDTYAEYIEHLAILDKIVSTYEKILHELGLFDKRYSKPISTSTLYLGLFDSIDVYIEGFPTNRELLAFFDISKTKPVRLFIQINQFSNKLIKKLLFFEIDLKNATHGRYCIDLGSRTIEQLSGAQDAARVLSASFGERVYQAGFVFYMIERFIAEGYNCDDICVVLPDESFAKILRAYDSKRNLNFAMGQSLSESGFYSRLCALRDTLCKGDDEAKAKLTHYGYGDLANDELSLGDMLDNLIKDESVELQDIVQNGLKKLERSIDGLSISVKNQLWLLTEMLSKQKQNDVGGGKITVVGPLETRGSGFKAVIIVDFNEQKVPRSDDKDLFLNAKIRSNCGLPSARDRDDLQCFYYDRIIHCAESVAISYVKNEKESASFLLNLFSHECLNFDDDDAASVMQKLLVSGSPKQFEIVSDDAIYELKKFSASSLKDFLECKRRYYFKYIKKIKEHIDESELRTSEMGTLFHNVAMRAIKPDSKSISSQALQEAFRVEMENSIKQNNMAEYAFEAYLLLFRLGAFFEFEAQRQENFTPKMVEHEFLFEYCGISFSGKIDRVDYGDDSSVSVLDYKLKNSVTTNSIKSVENRPEDIVDFQLPIYLLAVMDAKGVSRCDVAQCGYYDVYNAEIVEEEALDAKINLLAKIASDLSVKTFRSGDFTLCDKKANCRYCAYKEICGR